MHSRRKVLAVAWSLAGVFLSFMIGGGAASKPTYHTRKVLPVSASGRSDRMLAEELERRLMQQAWWGSNDLSPAQWGRLIALARLFQKAKPAVFEEAFSIFMGDEARYDPSDTEPPNPEEKMTRALLLLRLVFIYPNKPGPHPFGFGPLWRGYPLSGGFGHSDQNTPAWPVAWRDGHPHLTARLGGFDGQPYDPVAEYEYARHCFPLRTLPKALSHSARHIRSRLVL